jgi:hypothetical protein
MPDVLFQVYVFAEDCGEVTAYQSLEAMQGYMEAIDVENDEYEAWDATGRVLQVQWDHQVSMVAHRHNR